MNERFREGVELFRQRHFDAAIQVWQKLSDQGFEHPNLEFYLGVARHELDRQTHFVESFSAEVDRVFEDFRGGAPAVTEERLPLTKVRDLLDQRKYEEALPLLEDLARVRHGESAVHLLLARVNLVLGRLREALTACERAEPLAGDDPRTNATLGSLYLDLFKLDRAERHLRRAVDREESDVTAWTALGCVYFEERRLELAEECLRKALSLKPGLIGATSVLDEVRQAKEANQSLIHECQAVLAVHPDWPDWQHKLGVAHLSQGDYGSALECFSRALELNGRLAKTYYQRGLLHGYQEDHRRACEDLRRALEFADDYDDDLMAEAQKLEAQGLDEEAAAAYGQAMRLQPDYASRHIELAKQFLREELFDQAEREAQKGLLLSPTYPDGFFVLGEVLRKRGSLEQAVDAFYQAVEINPWYAQAILALVQCLVATGQMEEAGQLVRRYDKECAGDRGFLERLHRAAAGPTA